MEKTDYDILVIGGGMVGASQACALAPLGLKIGIIEAYPPRSDAQPSYDARSIALAYGSRVIFESMGLWASIKDSATPITNIHVSDRGQFGVARLSAADEGVDALGYVIENRFIGAALQRALTACSNVYWICPAKLVSLSLTPERGVVQVNIDGTVSELSAKLLIAADGGDSAVRASLDIGVRRWEYGQSAIISTVTPGLPHNNVAYERFTDSGPLALLPMSDNRCSLVYTVRQADVESVLALSDGEFLSLLNQRFGYRLGAFSRVAKRTAYPLSLLRSKEHVRHRLAVIGNAAHTLHPIAGQGFNLGLRDVAELADVITASYRQGTDFGALASLQRYANARRSDQVQVAFITDSMARVFSNRFDPLARVRMAGMLAIDLLPPLKHAVTRRAMGFVGRLPRLARGLPL